MKKIRITLMVCLMAFVALSSFKSKKRPRSLGDLYASSNGTTYYQLTSSTDCSQGFTTTKPSPSSLQSTIIDNYGTSYKLYTYNGSSYLALYASSTSGW